VVHAHAAGMLRLLVAAGVLLVSTTALAAQNKPVGATRFAEPASASPHHEAEEKRAAKGRAAKGRLKQNHLGNAVSSALAKNGDLPNWEDAAEAFTPDNKMSSRNAEPISKDTKPEAPAPPQVETKEPEVAAEEGKSEGIMGSGWELPKTPKIMDDMIDKVTGGGGEAAAEEEAKVAAENKKAEARVAQEEGSTVKEGIIKVSDTEKASTQAEGESTTSVDGAAAKESFDETAAKADKAPEVPVLPTGEGGAAAGGEKAPTGAGLTPGGEQEIAKEPLIPVPVKADPEATKSADSAAKEMGGDLGVPVAVEPKGEAELPEPLPPPPPPPEVTEADKKTHQAIGQTGLPSRGGARMGQPIFFSLFLVCTLCCFCAGVCTFGCIARKTILKTEDELRQLLDALRKRPLSEVIGETCYGTPVPVPILRLRFLVRKAIDDHTDAVMDQKDSMYAAVKKELLAEFRRASKAPGVQGDKEASAKLEEELRAKLLEERHKAKAEAERMWREYEIEDPVPSLPEGEETLQYLNGEYIKSLADDIESNLDGKKDDKKPESGQASPSGGAAPPPSGGVRGAFSRLMGGGT